jgi:hypothetical protein
LEPIDVQPEKLTEASIQAEIIKMMENKGWFVKETHGNMYQSGFPDLFTTHPTHGHRWIEVKKPGRQGAGCFTNAQLRDFPFFCNHGSGVWVLVAATDTEYNKLFKRHNWYQFLSVSA